MQAALHIPRQDCSPSEGVSFVACTVQREVYAMYTFVTKCAMCHAGTHWQLQREARHEELRNTLVIEKCTNSCYGQAACISCPHISFGMLQQNEDMDLQQTWLCSVLLNSFRVSAGNIHEEHTACSRKGAATSVRPYSGCRCAGASGQQCGPGLHELQLNAAPSSAEAAQSLKPTCRQWYIC